MVLALFRLRTLEPVDPQQIEPQWLTGKKLTNLEEQLFGREYERKQSIGGLVNAFMTSISVRENPDYSDPLLKYRAELDAQTEAILSVIKDLVKDNVVKIPQVQTLEFRGQYLVIQIFEAIASDPERFLTRESARRLNSRMSKTQEYRIICDYIAGMTDEYATRIYERHFLPRQGTVFQKL